MPFDALDRSVDLIRVLAPVLRRLGEHDAELTSQTRRAAQSVALNIAEANPRVGRDRRNRFRIALASAAEVAACLQVAEALGYVDGAEVAAAAALVDRVRAMTWRLAG